MANWTGIHAGLDNNNVSQDHNCRGPYYHGGLVYYFNQVFISPSIRIVAASSPDCENWSTITNRITISDNNGTQPWWYSMAEYKNGPTHILYIAILVNLFPEPDRLDLYQFDFPTETFSLLGTVDTTIPSIDTITDLGIAYFTGRNNLGDDTTAIRKCFARVDSLTGDCYIVYTGPGNPDGVCVDGGGNHPYNRITIGYKQFSFLSSTFGSYIPFAEAPPTKQFLSIQNAFMNAGRLYCILCRVTASTASGCGGFVMDDASGTTFELYDVTGAVTLAILSTYIYNGPTGCPPFDDPMLLNQAVPFTTTSLAGISSNGVMFGGDLYFSWMGPSRIMQIGKITSGGVFSSISSGVEVALFRSGGFSPTLTLGSNHQFFIKGSQLAIMWRNSYFYDVAYTWPTSATCTGTYAPYNFTASLIQQKPDWVWAIVNPSTLTLGSANVITAGDVTAISGTAANAPFCGLMPVIVPQDGTFYRAGDVTFVVDGAGGSFPQRLDILLHPIYPLTVNLNFDLKIHDIPPNPPVTNPSECINQI